MKVILPAMDTPGDEDGVQRERNWIVNVRESKHIGSKGGEGVAMYDGKRLR
jgi:hypothetical protein